MAAKQISTEELVRERDFFIERSQKLESRIRELEFDCATLQKREGELNQRLKELSYQKVVAYRQQTSPRRNFNRR